MEESIMSKLERGRSYLEEGDFLRAADQYRKLLKEDKENFQGYLGLLLATYEAKSIDDLSKLTRSIEKDEAYIKALQYADDHIKGKLVEISQKIDHNAAEVRYQRACSIMEDARNEKDFSDAAYWFAAALKYVPNYKDALMREQICKNRIERMNAPKEKAPEPPKKEVVEERDVYKDFVEEAKRQEEQQKALKAAEEEKARRQHAASVAEAAKKMLDQNNAQKAAQKTNTGSNSGTSGSAANSGTSGSAGTNTAAPKKKVNIGCLLVIALIIGVIIFCVKGIPQIRFNNAVKMFESGDDGWEELIEDLDMQPEMLEVIDARAKDLVDAGYVAEALDVMGEGMRINGLYWKERDAVAQEAALEAYSYGNYADACYYYNEMSEPDTSTEAYNHSHYVLGLQEIEVGDRDNVWNPYMNAAECLEKCSHYYDVSERILYAKYRCVSISLDREDPTLVTYMEDLMAAGYPGAQELYDDFYRWSLEPLGINSNQDDTETNLDTIGVNDPVYFHFMPTGGPPDGLVGITAHYRLPDGTEKSHAFSSEWAAGAQIWFGWHEGIYEEDNQKVAGTLTVDFYAQNGKIMGSMSVEMVE